MRIGRETILASAETCLGSMKTFGGRSSRIGNCEGAATSPIDDVLASFGVTFDRVFLVPAISNGLHVNVLIDLIMGRLAHVRHFKGNAI